MKVDILKEKSLLFAVRIVNLARFLREEKTEHTLSKQILKSGTNPGAMVRESKYAESDLDYIHKLAVAQKETNETLYWLELLELTNYLTSNQAKSIHDDGVEILKLLTSIIITKKKNIGLL